MVERETRLETDKEIADATDRAFQAVIERLGLPDGCHVFDVAHPKYTKVTVCRWLDSLASRYVQMERIPHEFGRTPSGESYMFVRSELVDLRDSEEPRHLVSDSIHYPRVDATCGTSIHTEWLEELESEYSASDTDGEFLSPELREFMRDVQSMLPTLRLDLYNSESEWKDDSWSPYPQATE